ncbi:MAG: cytochrome c biogenesis CcdA family protein [Pseudomonadota bacterium]
MMDVTLVGAFFAGLVTFFTPCVLPMVPFYLSYMAGLSMTELRADGRIAVGAQKQLIVSAIMFALGVTSIFMLLGAGATAVGQVFAEWRHVLRYLAAAIIFVFGLHFLGVVRIGLLYREARIDAKSDPSTIAGAYVMGLAFGFGWTACAGPVLGTILMIAGGMGDLSRGILLLAIFGIGMTLPFVVAALFAKPFLAWLNRNRSAFQRVEKVLGAMLILFAILIATDSVNEIANWMVQYWPAIG